MSSVETNYSDTLYKIKINYYESDYSESENSLSSPSSSGSEYHPEKDDFRYYSNTSSQSSSDCYSTDETEPLSEEFENTSCGSDDVFYSTSETEESDEDTDNSCPTCSENLEYDE